MSTNQSRNGSMESPFEHIEVGYGVEAGGDSFTVGAQAARKAAEGIGRHPVSAVLVFASARYDLKELLAGVESVLDHAPVFGTTTAGEICNRPLLGSVVVTVLASPDLQVRLGLGRDVSADWKKAVQEAVASSEIQPYFAGGDGDIWPELTRQGRSVFSLLFSPGNTRSSDSRSHEILEELKRLSGGRIPFFGGSAADDWNMETNYVLYNGEAHPDSFLAAVFETSLKFGVSMGHGFAPSDRRAVATKVNGHEVVELDGRNAADVYAGMLGSTVGDLTGRHLTLTSARPAGMLEMMDEYRINVASYFTSQGGVRFTQPVTQDSTITVMEASPEQLIMAARETLRKALVRGQIQKPVVVMVFSCALRGYILGERRPEEISAMESVLPGIPVLGFYSFGEQGVNDAGISCHGNEKITVLVLGDELSAGAEVALENRRLLRLQREAEKALREREEKFRFISENIADIVWTLDLRFNTTYVSPSVETVLGFTPDERVRQTVEEVMTPESLQRIQSRFLEELQREREGAADPNRSVKVDVEYYHKNGSTVWMENIVKGIRDSSGSLVGILGVSRDLTERKRAEEEREKLISELQEALAKVKTLSGLLPICACCKKVRDDKGYWNKIESYIKEHSDVDFTHSICPECAEKLYPDLDVSTEEV